MTDWPVSIDEILSARERLRPHLAATPLRHYPALDNAVGRGIRVLVKHENFQPTGAFKVRNAVSALTLLLQERAGFAPASAAGGLGGAAQHGYEQRAAERAGFTPASAAGGLGGVTQHPPERGVVAATRGNHGLGLAWAGRRLGVAVTVCVPEGNNPEKNAAIRALGARLVEEGRDYDESVAVADRLVAGEGLHLVHSTNDRAVVAGAGTLTLEMLEEEPAIEALVCAVGGGSQAVGGLTVARARPSGTAVYGVQAAGASAIHDAWHLGRPVFLPSADTFADGLAPRGTYPFTFGALREGLAGFVSVTDARIADAVRLLLSTTHTLVEGAGAAGLAGLFALREQLAGRTVGIVLSGANIEAAVLRRILNNQL
jgi:threonine dehydratase